MPLVTVVVPTLGNLLKLNRLLDSLTQQDTKFPFEVVLVENSGDSKRFNKVRELFSKFLLKGKVVASPHRGVNYARNAGIENSQGEYLLFIDDDCWISDKFLLKKHLMLHQQNPEVFCFGGVYNLSVDAGFFDRSYHAIQMKWLHLGINTTSNNNSRYLIGGHFSMKKKLWVEKPIRFDQQIVYGGSELGFFLEATASGRILKLENLMVVHQTAESFFSVSRKVFKQGAGKARIESNQIKEMSQSAQSADTSFFQKVCSHWFSLIFWLGYFWFKKDALGFLRYCSRKLRLFHHSLFKTVTHEIDKKIKRGDRF